MCGIHLIIDKKKQLDETPIEKMLAQSMNRGPDASDYIKLDHSSLHQIYLGGNRLRIMDPDNTADQPLSDENNNYFLAYNGEIYNYFDLRNEILKKGFRFNTRSDSEVLLKSMMIYEDKVIPQLNGMFSFIYVDTLKDQVYIARDRHGMKPLFYYNDENYFIACSEAGGIIASGLIHKSLAKQQINHYLAFRYIFKTTSLYENIKQVQEARYISYSAEEMKIHAFQKNSLPRIRKSEDLRENELLFEIEELLVDSLTQHLNADVKCGIFLSGGIDSTLLLALINANGLHPVPSYSIIFGDESKKHATNDTYYSKKASEMFGSQHYELMADPTWLFNLKDFIKNLDQPIGDTGALLTYHLARKAKEQVGVVLSGAGADEVFAGYNRHWAYYNYLKNYNTLQKLMPLFKKVSGVLPTGPNHPLKESFRLFKRFSSSLSSDPVKTFLNFLRYLNIHVPSKYNPNLRTYDGNANDPYFTEYYMKQGLWYDKNYYLIGDVLAVNDRMSMAHNLEMRMPFLDNRLVEYMNNLPANYRIFKGRKWILNKLLRRQGGRIFTKRKKEGFGIPIAYWLRTDAYEALRPYFEKKNLIIYDFLDYESVQELIKRHHNKKADNSQELWNIFTLSAWLEENFGQ